MGKERTIVFVPRRSRIRPYKIAKALSYLEGVRTVLICEESFYDPVLHDGVFDKVRFYKKAPPFGGNKYVKTLDNRLRPRFSSLERMVREESPDLIHAFCEPYDHISHLLKNLELPVVMSDGADFTGITAGLENVSKNTAETERFCLEQVDGICYKGPPEVLDYYRRYGYKIQGEELSWPDYCDEELFKPVNGASSSDERLHMVYSGNISTDPKVRYCYYIPLAQELSRQRIHFHLYPNPYQFKTSKEYKELAEKDAYFHFHKPLPLKGLIDEISVYDWGLWVHAKDPSFRTSPAKMKTGIGNKFFSYLEAGLPVVVSDSREYGVEMVERYGIGFSLPDERWGEIRSMIQDMDQEAIRENVQKGRKTLSLQSNAWRLMDFYLRVIKKKKDGF